jgi:hypothetical protein
MFHLFPRTLRAAAQLSAAIFSLLVLMVSNGWAEWDPDGLPVCTADNYQVSLVSVPDEAGGMLMAWQDYRDSQIKIYAQRVTETGTLLWTADGVLVGGSESFHPGICADGAGGAWVVYSTQPTGYGAIHVRHIDATGAVGSIVEIAGGSVWSHNSLPVCCSDGAAGAIVAWVQEVDPPSGDLQIVAQRLSSGGTRLWGTQGVLVYNEIDWDLAPTIAADEGCHGAFIGWKTTTGAGIVQRLDASGVRRFNGANGYSLGLVNGSRVMIADRQRSSQGCFVMFRWHHDGTGIFDYDALSVVAVDSTAYEFWEEVVSAGGGGTSADPPGFVYRVMGNGNGGACCVWDLVDSSSLEGRGVYAQSLASNGDKEWGGTYGLQVSEATDDNFCPDAAVQAGGGVFASWIDKSGADRVLRYANIEPSMGVVIARTLVPGGNARSVPRVVTDPLSWSPKALICWEDYRTAGETDIYAAGLRTNGSLLQPNLAATRLTPEEPYGIAGGDPQSFYVMVKNLGSCASDSFWTTVYPDLAAAPGVGDPPGAGVHSVHCGPLAAYDSVLVEVLIDAPATSQTWSMWGFADYLGDVDELDDEDDNVVGPVSYEWLGYANLEITRVVASDPEPYPGDYITMTVTVKNTGSDAASPVWIDYWVNEPSAPPEGETGDERHSYFNIDPGDSVVWTTSALTTTTFSRWSSWFRVDTGDLVEESNEDDNLSGPHYIDWQIPPEDGWPRSGGGKFHSSPAIANLDGDPTTLEVVIGCDDHKVYAWGPGGASVPGWPVTLPDTVRSSPAVGDISGDSHNEVVVGCNNGKLYAYDYEGAKLWEYATANPVNTTPALADLDSDGKLEIVFGSGGTLYALEGNGTPYPGSWPYSAGALAKFTSPAVGNVDGAGGLEIAAIAYGFTKPASSKVYLLKTDGTLYSGSWPATVDTIIVADPVLGNIASLDTDLEIVSGGINGVVYAWNKNAVLWPSPPRVPGMIETSPALAELDGADAYLEIVVTSRRYVSTLPPHWEAVATAIDNTGSVMLKWPKSFGSWLSGFDAAPSAIIAGSGGGRIMVGGRAADLHAWDRNANEMYGFPLDAVGSIYTSAAVGNLDNDGWLEIVVAAADSVRCWELCSSGYGLDDLWWPMFRHDRARTGCYGFEIPTGVDDDEGRSTPAASAIRSMFPNPFNPVTRITFDIGARTAVELSIYDVSGRRVATLVREELEAGRYEAVWNGRATGGRTAASGVYFCRLEAGGAVETRKMVLLR